MIADYLNDAVDLHIHPNPSPFPKRIGIAEAAKQAAARGYRGIAVKSHHHSMVTDVAAVEETLGGLPLPVLSGVALNSQTGGMNPHAVDLALAMGGRIVWMPTTSSNAHCAAAEGLNFPKSETLRLTEEVEPIFNQAGKLNDSTHEVLRLIRERDAILSTGHLGPKEADAVITEALRLGIDRIILHHPGYVVNASEDDCRKWAAKGVYIEHSLAMYHPDSSFHTWDMDNLVNWIQVVGHDQTIFGSDLGQVGNPLPVECFDWVVAELLKLNVSDAEILALIGGNAAQLAGL